MGSFVKKALVLALISQTALAVPLPELRLALPSPSSSTNENCARSIDRFVRDAREIMPDVTIVLDQQQKMTPGPGEAYAVHCHKLGTSDLELKDTKSDSIFSFRYSDGADGFLPIDWLAFQRRSSELSRPVPKTTLPEFPKPLPPETEPNRWWLWAGVGALAASAGFLLYRR